jgi:hypothetical protein
MNVPPLKLVATKRKDGSEMLVQDFIVLLADVVNDRLAALRHRVGSIRR